MYIQDKKSQASKQTKINLKPQKYFFRCYTERKNLSLRKIGSKLQKFSQIMEKFKVSWFKY